jgi:hypothetical protein
MLISLVLAITHPKETKRFVQDLLENTKLAAKKPSDIKIISDAKQMPYDIYNFNNFPVKVVSVSIEGVITQKSEAKAYVNVQYIFTDAYSDNALLYPTTYKKGQTIQEKYTLKYIKSDRDWLHNGSERWSQ